MQKLEWDEGIQTRFPAVLRLTHYGWFLCNMQYLYWSWYLHMCADVSCLTFWQFGWLPCALCSAAAVLTLVLQVFQNIWHIWQPQTGTPSSTPMDFICWLERDLSFSFYASPNMINEGENMPRICLWSGLRDPGNHDMARLHFKELCHQAV